MVDLTVANVAALIAAAVFIARIWSPNTLTLIAAGVAGDRNTAATWTWLARLIQQSLWPDVLRSDSARTNGVRSDVKALSRLTTIMGCLISITGVITPLGLYEAVVPTTTEPAHFQYVPDKSPFGYGTPPRSLDPFSRVCSLQSSWLSCPFSDTVAIQNPDGNFSFPHGYDAHIPSMLAEIYSSGVNNNSTVSNYFDIQWRRYTTRIDSSGIIQNGSSYPVSSFRPLQSVILNNAIDPVEGLIVDTVNGSIGFRNHTSPSGFPSGVSWTEDILFIEPETVCVDMNLTLDFTVVRTSMNSVFLDKVFLTDRGGFANLDHTYPEFDQSHPQSNPDLWNRAYKAALMSNSYTMFYYNVSNPAHHPNPGMSAFAYVDSHVGKTFPLVKQTSNKAYDGLKIDGGFWDYWIQLNDILSPSSLNSTTGVPANPFQVNETWFQQVGNVCRDYYGDDNTPINNILIGCGYVYGVPQRQDNGSGLIFDSGSRWSKPLYMCATATKALIKTVTYNYNGTKDLKSLSITDVRNKVYSDKADLPIWGVENFNVSQWPSLNPIWGLISKEYQDDPNVSSVQQDALYLPGYNVLQFTASETESLPGSDFLSDAVSTAYNVASDWSNVGMSALVDYSGDTQMSMWVKWQDLSGSVGTVSRILNLIWTDYAASALIGTKGVLGPGNSAAADSVSVHVLPFRRCVRYHLSYAIPAIATILFLLIISATAIVTCIRSRVSFNSLRRQVYRSSTGRILTAFLYPRECGMESTSREWCDKMGKAIVELSAQGALELDVLATSPKPDEEIESHSHRDDSLAEEGQLLAHGGPAR